ncbi:glyoxalase superfamily protein [Agrobacterium sp. NPDC090273]|uniref:glyoxalase superfamily protein n=1 Tax=Agrobacterium sp. NPDC090273 TaxID=3363919 RepID=UPI00383A595E
MRNYLDAKLMARALKSSLEQGGTTISHSQALEIVARQFDCDNWNVLAAKIEETERGAGIGFDRVSPIIRIFDEDKAREFYVGFLGFTIDWEHRFGENFPLYMQVSRAGLSLHLSGHHGDATPGSNVFVTMKGVRAFQKELAAKQYTFMKPGVESEPWGDVMQVTDPFSNRIRFCEQRD